MGFHVFCSYHFDNLIVFIQGHADLIDQLRKDPELSARKSAIEALDDLQLLFRYLSLFDLTDKIQRRFTLTVSREKISLGHV